MFEIKNFINIETAVFVIIMENIVKDVTSFEIFQSTFDIYQKKYPYDEEEILKQFTEASAEHLPDFALKIWCYYFDKRKLTPQFCTTFL